MHWEGNTDAITLKWVWAHTRQERLINTKAEFSYMISSPPTYTLVNTEAMKFTAGREKPCNIQEIFTSTFKNVWEERRGENEGQGLPPCSTDFPIFCTLHFTLWHGTSISWRVLHEKMKESTWNKVPVVEGNKVLYFTWVFPFSDISYFNLTTF